MISETDLYRIVQEAHMAKVKLLEIRSRARMEGDEKLVPIIDGAMATLEQTLDVCELCRHLGMERNAAATTARTMEAAYADVRTRLQDALRAVPAPTPPKRLKRWRLAFWRA